MIENVYKSLEECDLRTSKYTYQWLTGGADELQLEPLAYKTRRKTVITI